MSTHGPSPRPAPAGPDVDALRSAFDDLLADSVGAPGAGAGMSGAGADDTGADGAGTDDIDGTVRDHQVEALDAAHELLAQALTALDSAR